MLSDVKRLEFDDFGDPGGVTFYEGTDGFGDGSFGGGGVYDYTGNDPSGGYSGLPMPVDPGVTQAPTVVTDIPVDDLVGVDLTGLDVSTGPDQGPPAQTFMQFTDDSGNLYNVDTQTGQWSSQNSDGTWSYLDTNGDLYTVDNAGNWTVTTASGNTSGSLNYALGIPPGDQVTAPPTKTPLKAVGDAAGKALSGGGSGGGSGSGSQPKPPTQSAVAPTIAAATAAKILTPTVILAIIAALIIWKGER